MDENAVSEIEVVEEVQDIFAYGHNIEAEEEGNWVTLVFAPISVKTRGINSDAFQKVRSRIYDAYTKTQTRGAPIPAKVDQSLAKKALAYGLLLDWKGVKVAGEDVPFSAARAYEILSDKRIPEFAAEIIEAANIKETFYKANVAEAEKN